MADKSELFYFLNWDLIFYTAQLMPYFILPKITIFCPILLLNPCLVTSEFCPMVFPFPCSNVSSRTESGCRSASLSDCKYNMALDHFHNWTSIRQNGLHDQMIENCMMHIQSQSVAYPTAISSRDGFCQIDSCLHEHHCGWKTNFIWGTSCVVNLVGLFG